MFGARIRRHMRSGGNLTFENLEREGIGHQALDRALQRTGTEGWIVAFPEQEFAGLRSQPERHLAFFEVIAKCG